MQGALFNRTCWRSALLPPGLTNHAPGLNWFLISSVVSVSRLGLCRGRGCTLFRLIRWWRIWMKLLRLLNRICSGCLGRMWCLQCLWFCGHIGPTLWFRFKRTCVIWLMASFCLCRRRMRSAKQLMLRLGCSYLKLGPDLLPIFWHRVQLTGLGFLVWTRWNPPRLYTLQFSTCLWLASLRWGLSPMTAAVLAPLLTIVCKRPWSALCIWVVGVKPRRCCIIMSSNHICSPSQWVQFSRGWLILHLWLTVIKFSVWVLPLLSMKWGPHSKGLVAGQERPLDLLSLVVVVSF